MLALSVPVDFNPPDGLSEHVELATRSLLPVLAGQKPARFFTPPQYRTTAATKTLRSKHALSHKQKIR